MPQILPLLVGIINDSLNFKISASMQENGFLSKNFPRTSSSLVKLIAMQLHFCKNFSLSTIYVCKLNQNQWFYQLNSIKIQAILK